nr:reverse transcriptase domain-containing protein [Tanacetum cinerariifolium]GEY97022.1 reverse transcriptase domain-containing protein [Tanacetum cinerariifolium]
MSTNEQTPLSQPTSAVRNTLGEEQAPQTWSGLSLTKLCENTQEKLKAVKARLNFEEASRYFDSETPSRRRNLKERLGPSIPGKLPLIEKCIKDPVEIHNIKQRDGESMEEFVQRYKLECRDIKGASKCMKISEFMHEITNPELIKRLHDKIPKSMDEMMSVTTTFLRGEVAASNRERKKSFPSWKQLEAGQKQNFKRGNFGNEQMTERKQDRFTLLTKTPKEILALDKGKFKPPPPMTTLVEKRNASKFWEFHEEVGHTTEELISFPTLGEEDGIEGPMIIEAEIRGQCVHRMYLDGGYSSEILYEHCFSKFHPKIKNQLIPANTPLVGFSKEIIWPLGQISLLVKIGDEEHLTSAWMNFMVVRSPSPYNGILGRTGVRKIRAIPSTAHGMLKFLVAGEIVTLRRSRIIPLECSMVSKPGVPRRVINQVAEENIQVAIHPEYQEQTIAIGSTITEEGRKELCGLLRCHLDVFSWKPAYMTRVPRHVAEHRLNVREGCLPVRQKKKGKAPERNKAIGEEVKKLVEADIMKEVHYHIWLLNPVMVKKHDDSWRMCVDFKDLNKACPKDGYPLPKIDWKVESLCGYPYKCFLDAYKGYYQIKMAEEDRRSSQAKEYSVTQKCCSDQKTLGQPTNAGATYQRLVDKAFQKQIGRNLEYERRVNNRHMHMQESKIDSGSALDIVLSQALDADLAVMESNGTESGMHDTSSSLGNYITRVVDENIRPVNVQVPFAEVQLIAQHNVLANEQQHTDQSEPIYDTYLLEKVDSNTSTGSINISHRGGEIDQDAKHDQVKSPLLKAEFLKTKDMVEKEVYNELSNRFLQLEKHCFSLEISIQQKEESFQTN